MFTPVFAIMGVFVAICGIGMIANKIEVPESV